MNNNKKKYRLAFTLIIIFICLCSYVVILSSLSVQSDNSSYFSTMPLIIFFLSVIMIITLFVYLVKADKSHKILLEQAEMSTLATVGSKLMMWELIVDSGVMTFSDSFFLLTGYEKQLFEPSILSLKHRIHPDDIDDFNQLFCKTDDSKETNQVRCRLKKQNGEYIWIDAIARAHYNESKKLQFAGIFLDVTKKVKDEQELLTEEQIIDKLMKLATIQAWTWNTQDKKFKFILNTSPENKNIRTLEDFLSFILENDAKKVSVAISDYINQKTSECYVQFRDKTGEKWYEFLAYTLNYDPKTEKPFQFVGFQRDITEIKRLNELYLESQKVETISRLAGGMAHDFNNILQVIHGFADLAIMDIDEETDLSLNMQHAMQGIEKAEDLVEQLLTFSRDDLNRPFPLIVSDTLNNFVNLISKEIEQKNIDFKLKNNIADSRVYADPKKLDQILSKLVDNSIAAVPENGKIRIETNYQVIDKAESRFGLGIKPGKYIVISVEDNGSGITPDIKPLIFDPFFTTKDVGEGRGLGLSTVYNCVRSHDGFINVVSRPEIDGTRFDIYFPEYVLINRKISPSEFASDFKKNGDSPVVLVVDDFQISVNVIKKHLGDKYVILESTRGDEALELFDEMYESIDVVILDCIMNNTNGMKIYKQMLEKKPGLPVIFMSGYTKNDVEKQFGEEIKDIFLLKPVHKEVLLTALNNLIRYDYKE